MSNLWLGGKKKGTFFLATYLIYLINKMFVLEIFGFVHQLQAK